MWEYTGMCVMITTVKITHIYKNSEKTQDNKMAAVKVVIFLKKFFFLMFFQCYNVLVGNKIQEKEKERYV